MPLSSIRFSSSAIGSILVHRGHNKNMARSYPLNAKERSEFKMHENVEDIELHSQ